jgi:hypothetical protein
MNFRLTKKFSSSNSVRSTFHVLNSAGDIVGSINVAPSEEADLLKHWAGPTAAGPSAAPKAKSHTLLDAFRKQAAVLSK